MLRLIFVLASVVALSGCASQLGAFYNRPVIEDNADKALSTFSLAADRRTVVVSTEGSNRGKFCAEPPPDTANGIKTEFSATAEAKAKSEKAKLEAEGKLQANDKFETNVVVLADRTPGLDMFRTGVYALCQFNLNGAIPNDQVVGIFNKLIDAFTSAQKPLEKK